MINFKFSPKGLLKTTLRLQSIMNANKSRRFFGEPFFIHKKWGRPFRTLAQLSDIAPAMARSCGGSHLQTKRPSVLRCPSTVLLVGGLPRTRRSVALDHPLKQTGVQPAPEG
jgi:hypothetical protein